MFVEQSKFDADDASILDLPSIDNIIFRTEDPKKKWIEQATERVGDWRAFVRSVFMRWAITINALHVARDRYAANPGTALTIDTLRPGKDGPERVHMAIWPAEQTAQNYEASIPLIAAYAVQDLFGAMEEIIFALYEIFLEQNPQSLMEGRDYRHMRAAYQTRSDGPDEARLWEELWTQRFEGWRRRRIFDGLNQVFSALWRATGLARPSWFKHTDIEVWSRTIELIAELRNLVTHGADEVSQRLADLSAAQPYLGLDYVVGAKLEISVSDLWVIENFLDTLLTAINSSLFELGIGAPMPAPRKS